MKFDTAEEVEAQSLLEPLKVQVNIVRKLKWQDLYVFILHLIVLALASGIWHIYQRGLHDPSQLVYSPASEAIEYHVVDFGKFFIRRNEYMGPYPSPTNETDRLWEELYEFGQSTLIPRWQAELLENKTERQPGGNGYLIELDVFHQLHCLDLLRKALHPNRYPGWEYKADGSVDTGTTRFQHWDHCIDALRQTLMCHGDIHPLRHRINKINGILAPDLSTRHTCRNFTKIQEWARERQAPLYETHIGTGTHEMRSNVTLEEDIATEV